MTEKNPSTMDQITEATPCKPQPIEDAYDKSGNSNESMRYHRMRLLAEGGLGEVHVARDENLDRVVALKTIKPEFCDNRSTQSRFRAEAEITGKLEHPAIVPVYDLTADSQGLPYYTMRLIKGETLTDVVKRLYANGPIEHLEFRRLLSRFVAVCQAVAHAHRRGVVHRDIKPSNIMLGPNDETLLVDWGLAKLIPIDLIESDRAEVQSSSQLNDSSIDTACDASLLQLKEQDFATQLGSAVGTPGFMSPEQALGQTDRTTNAVDIFSLGATLYVILTGRAPFTGETAVEVMARTAVGKFEPPRHYNSSIDPALQAICLKAMSLSPDARYRSAEEMADDLTAYLADEPVSAWREPTVQRVRRYIRRHQDATIVGVGAMVCFIILLAIGMALLGAANHRESLARKDADRRRIEAEDNLRLAMRSVDRFMTRVASDEAGDADRIDPDLRLELLGDAKEFFERFVDLRPTDSPLMAEWGRVHVRLSQINDALGHHDEAMRGTKKAIEILTTNLAEQPDNEDLISTLAMARDRYGALLLEAGRTKESLAEMSEALKLHQKLIDAHPDRPALRNRPASILQNLAAIDYDAARFDQGLVKTDRAIEHLSAAIAAPEDNEQVLDKSSALLQLAQLRRNRALMLQSLERGEESLAELRSAKSILKQLLSDHPTSAVQSALAATMADIGVRLSSDPETSDQAVAQFDEAIRLARFVTIRHPANLDHRRRLAMTLNNYAALLVSRNDPFGAKAAAEESVQIQREMLEKSPAIVAYRTGLVSTLSNLAYLNACLGEVDTASALCNEARRHLENSQSNNLPEDAAEQELTKIDQIEKLIETVREQLSSEANPQP